jgi:hypothetical protein
VNAILDRAGLNATTAVEVEVGSKPVEKPLPACATVAQ